MKATHYHISGPISGVCKQSAIWARESGTSGFYPIVFLQRPKWIKDDSVWGKIVDSVNLKLPINFDVK